MTNTDKIKNKPYRNWVRGALGLFYLHKGLYRFTDRVVKAEHARIIQHLTPCTGCAIENILPVHAASGKGCIQKNKGKCNCRKRTNRNCPTCSQIYDDIVHQHRFKEPHWVTDCSTWYSDHWQFAKCFLTTTIKGSNNTAADTDVSGLLSIIINGEFFQSELHCSIDPYTGTDIFSQVREIRNEILHNSEQDLMDQDLTRYLQSMIAVLEDKKVLSTDPVAQAAAKKLKELLKDELVITISEEANLIQTALEAIKAAKEQSEESIRKLAEEKRNTIKASEEGIRELAEETRSSLRKQTSDLTSEIDSAKERAMEKVTSAVSAAKPDLNELKHGLADHENRLRAVEAEQKNLQRKQLELEQHVAKLKIAEEKHHTRIEYLKQKQDLQQHLVDEYQKEDVKTSISPLKTEQNNVNISDVYASPRMVVGENDKDGNTTEAGEIRATNNKHIEIGDLFGTVGKRNRKIFIVGDVGTGKSSLCKMMMQHWCSSIKERRNTDDSVVMDEEGVTQEKDNDTYGMNQFDFLFYVPLREMQEDTDDIVNMIKGRLKMYKTLVDDIFTNDLERVLIIADGLDELTPSNSRRPQWIPKSSQAGESTILTTSRPSSRGILKMKSSDCDLKVILLGLKDGNSVQYMIKKYMNLMDKKSDYAAFNDALSDLPFKDIENAPMLLQQIIWLYCNNYDIGKSRTSVYIHIVNAILGWEYERHGDYPKLQSSSFKHLSLPTSVADYPRCQENPEMLLILGKIAHDVYIKGNDSSFVFGQHKLRPLGISATDIDAILKTGILTEFNCADPTYEKSQLSFIHTSYMEFFAALYICSCYLSGISDSHSSVTPLTILEGLIAVSPETSVTEILRLENVLTMICGLVPGLVENICECIYKLTPSDENMDRWVKCQIHDLTSYCLSEHYSVDQETAVKCKLRHLYHNIISPGMLSKRFSDLVPTSVETCYIDMSSSMLSYEECLSLTSFLSQTVSLRTLIMKSIRCREYGWDYTIDITNHKELQSVKLSDSKISVSGIDHTCLKSFKMSDCELSPEQCSLLSLYLSQTVSLRTLEIHHMDTSYPKFQLQCLTIYLTHHKELQSVELSGNAISVSGINPTCLQSCKISYCEFSHLQCSLLSSCLSQAVSLRTLEIDCITCPKDECEGHTIDLTNHKELQSAELSGSKISVSGINHTCLQSCKISNIELSHEQCSLLLSCLSKAVLLRTLEVDRIKCSKDECESHAIDLTNHRQLQNIKISDSKTSVSGIKNTVLESCILSNSVAATSYVKPNVKVTAISVAEVAAAVEAGRNFINSLKQRTVAAVVDAAIAEEKRSSCRSSSTNLTFAVADEDAAAA
ncbi:uncharacterized protein LOC128553773 [Mercenaria mercenaria]|uniref:uncharacterized protein LOC128553773 n=1 Tax=Mercenaria mercenaria TaxID=6596 RepID=UPI00234F3A93|nr:uncharacterized protein LOC128553773 [Mercenaria mercenaria]